MENITATIILHTINGKYNLTEGFSSKEVNVLNSKESIESLNRFVSKINKALPKRGDLLKFAYVEFSSGQRNLNFHTEAFLGCDTNLDNIISECQKIDGFRKDSLVKLHDGRFDLNRVFKRRLSWWLASDNKETLAIINSLYLDADSKGYWLNSAV